MPGILRRLSPRVPTPACALAELGRCPAPCEHEITPEEYAHRAALPFRTATYGDPQPLVDALLARILWGRGDEAGAAVAEGVEEAGQRHVGLDGNVLGLAQDVRALERLGVGRVQ